MNCFYEDIKRNEPSIEVFELDSYANCNSLLSRCRSLDVLISCSSLSSVHESLQSNPEQVQSN